MTIPFVHTYDMTERFSWNVLRYGNVGVNGIAQILWGLEGISQFNLFIISRA